MAAPDEALDQDTETTRERVVQRDFLTQAQVDEALAEFRASGTDGKFDSFLVSKGLLTPRQLGELLDDPGDTSVDLGATVVGETPVSDATLVGDSGLSATTADADGPIADATGDAVVGRTFSGCVVQRKLGQGGMGAVYLAIRESDGLEVVVKFLATEMARNPSWRGRFVREAQVMQRIAHPNIVGIFSVEAEGDAPYIVMEFVDGEPLDEALVDRGSFDPAEAARIARDMARGLAHAHEGGVIHRDVKPANCLLGKGGEVKLLDFGLAKNLEADDGLSVAGQVLGTPHYMAPEQWGDHMVDARCDVFSLGATLYHLVTGEVPFTGRNVQAVSRKVLAGEFEPPSNLAELPRNLELVMFRMLETERSFRYPTAKAVADDLQRVLDEQPVDVPRLIEQRGERKVRHPLLPGASFVLGREESCEVQIRHRSVSRQHARIERGKTGFVLHDLGSTYGCFVGGMRVRTVVLKDKDEIKLGKVQIQFRDGGLGRGSVTKKVTAERLRVRTLPQPLVDVLVGLSDRRTVVSLLEQLAPDAIPARLQAARRRLRALLDGDLAEAVGRKLERALKRQRARAPQRLFAITHENLADDSEAWLAWWDQARPNYPAQIVPQQPVLSARLKLLKGESKPRAIPLKKHVAFSIGRDQTMRIPLDSLSVSRHHATIFRFHQRLAIRDEGSRFGTLVNGARHRIVFLKPGDRIVMGKIELELQVARPDPGQTAVEGGAPELDPEAFFVLAEMKHVATAAGLVRLMQLSRNTLWIKNEAQALFPQQPEQSTAFGEHATKLYLRKAERARELLPHILGADRGDSPDAWARLLAKRRDELGIQLNPRGWFPA